LTTSGDGIVAKALDLLPGGIYLITSCFEGKRAGATALAAMHCSTEPLLLCVASRKGHGIEPIIRDSHHFALCVLDPNDKLMSRKFSTMNREADNFDSLPVETLVSSSPVIKRSLVAFDCEVVRHFDMEADHELYIGRILAARIYAQPSTPSPTPPRTH
jgi:flavin reductase (DIM6/NTAB) family NADH-FMN oxidoreductase RutF